MHITTILIDRRKTNLYIKWIGAAIISLCAIFVSRGYSAFAERRLGQYGGFIALLEHIEGRIIDSLAYGDRLWSGFGCEESSVSSFVNLLQNGVSPKEAFDNIRGGLYLPNKATTLLSESFSSFGLECCEREIERIHSARETLSVMLDEENADCEKSKKTFTAILFGVSASVIIMLI